MQNNLGLIEAVKKAEERLGSPEERLGKELCQPFSAASSGSRKLMFGTHMEHCLPLMNSEVPLIQTGFEAEYGHNSSSFCKAANDSKVITKINKFSNRPDFHYFVILLRDDGMLDVVTRVSYHHITETYGYRFDTTYLDSLVPGSIIKAGDVIFKSTSFDKYNNRMDGVNTLVTYLACNDTLEDAILISETAAKKFVSPLFKKIQLIVNDNDILLNMYGDKTNYKTIPDIGECVNNGILAAIRREDKDESFFTQAFDRLSKIMMSDEKITTEGKVIDIDVYCNNPDNIKDSIYNVQLYKYWNERLKWCSQLYYTVNKLMEQGHTKMTYDLQKLYSIAKDTLEGKKYNRTKPFSNIGLDITVMEETPLCEGDKLSNRYGGKGVVKIVPDKSMPRLALSGEPLEMIYNQATVTNRLNLSQLFEYEINHIAYTINQMMVTSCIDVADCLSMLLEFIEIFNPRQAEYYKKIVSGLTDDEVISFIDCFATDKGIMLSLLPVTDNVTIDKLEKAKKAFPFSRLSYIEAPIVDSGGNVRYVRACRPIVCGEEYIYRLKQYAKEKFSTTSLSSTNLRGENSRSKAASMYKGVNTKTPIRMGEMETMASAHLGMDVVVFMLMLNATSPSARRRAEELITSPTITVDVKLGENDSSRIVESLNAYLKAMGLKLTFEKKYVGLQPVCFRDVLHRVDLKTAEGEEKNENDVRFLTDVIVRLDRENDKATITPLLTRDVIYRVKLD